MNSDTSESSSFDSTVPTKLMIGILILFVIIAMMLTYCGTKLRRRIMLKKLVTEIAIKHFNNSNELINAINLDLTDENQIERLPYHNKFEFPREKLKFGGRIGSGEFGYVVKATATNICENEETTTVAVKTVRNITTALHMTSLIRELKILIHIGKHLNIVNLLGACTEKVRCGELLVIVEYCEHGNLRDYLLKYRRNFINSIGSALKIKKPVYNLFPTPPTDANEPNEFPQLPQSISNSFSSCGSLGSEFQFEDSEEDCTGSNIFFNSQPIVCAPETSQNCFKMTTHSTFQPTVENTTPKSSYVPHEVVSVPTVSKPSNDYQWPGPTRITIDDLIIWAFQVASGMEYLTRKKVLHADLAARNILLADKNVVKLCDFGMAKNLYNNQNYAKKSETPIPLKWMAIETIKDNIFSTKSDVWSFGIVLWEFFALGEVPYPGLDNMEVLDKLIEGYRMKKPEYTPQEVADVMEMCWDADPEKRPTFCCLVETIGNFLEDNVKLHLTKLSCSYENANPLPVDTKVIDIIT